MLKIIGMASEDRRRCSHSQPTPEAEVPSPIFTIALVESPEGPILVDPSEVGPSEMDPSEVDPNGIIILFI